MVFKSFFALKMSKPVVNFVNDVKFKLFTDLEDLKIIDIIQKNPEFSKFELFKLDGENLKQFLIKYL